MRKLLLLVFSLPLLIGAPSPSAQTTCTIDPQTEPIIGQVGTELTFFITVTGCASSNKQPSFRIADGRLPRGTKLFDFAGSSGLVNGVPTTAGTYTFTIRVTDDLDAFSEKELSITIK